MNRVEEMFLDKSIDRSGIIVYSKKDALDFIEECRKNGIKLLGIDGFYISGIYTQPSMEHSVDYSYEDVSVVYDRAAAFLTSRPDELYFEIVCG